MIYVGSARHDENGKLTNGKAGDQLQKSGIIDMKGEVSCQEMYNHKKGFYIIRPIDGALAEAIAYEMVLVCNNPNYGYDQYNRYGIIKNGTRSTVPTECDCSSTIRAIVTQCCGVDPGDFTTVNERSILLTYNVKGKKIFTDAGKYISQDKTPVYNGDILVTCTKGHTVVVCAGSPRNSILAKKEIPTVATPTLKKGSKGTEVEKLQADLNYLGFNLEVDGKFGSNTQSALKNWQRNNGLVDDGVYGPKSYSKMKGLIC